MNELKRELSKLSGVDFFNPKYRDVFKKYFSDKEDAKEEVEVEDVKDEVVDEKVETVEDKVEDVVEETTEDVVDTEPEKEAVEEAAEEVVEETKEETVEEVVDEPVEEVVEDTTDVKAELLDAKIELELIKNGVKPEKLETAKKYVKHEIVSLEDVEKVRDIIGEFPDWVTAYKSEDIGMSVDDDGDALTEEEKRLKQMGINPR